VPDASRFLLISTKQKAGMMHSCQARELANLLRVFIGASFTPALLT
jgi:hypothetical protein